MENIVNQVNKKIYFIRGHRVMLDSDLAELYEVTSKRLNEYVKRNLNRFPDDFMFQLTEEEYEILRSQFAMLRLKHGKHRKFLPHVFTEQGIAMLSSVLRSDRAVEVNIRIMRAFVLIRELRASNKEIEKRLTELEKKYTTHDKNFTDIFEAIWKIMNVREPSPRKVGFKW